MDPSQRAAPLTVSERIMIFETRSTPCLRQPSGQCSSSGPANDGGDSTADTSNSQGHTGSHRSPKPGLAARSNSAFAPGSKSSSLYSKENARSQSELRTGQRQQSWQQLHLPSSRAGSATIPAASAIAGGGAGQAVAAALARGTTAVARVPALALSQLQSGSLRAAASGPERKSENRRAASEIQIAEHRSGSRAPLVASMANNSVASAEASVAGGTVTAAPTALAAAAAAAAIPVVPPPATLAGPGSNRQVAAASHDAALERHEGGHVAATAAPPASNAPSGAGAAADATIAHASVSSTGSPGNATIATEASGNTGGHGSLAVPSHMSAVCLQLRRIALPARRAEDNYEISEHGSDSEADDKADEPDRRSKHVPKWCGSYLQDLQGQSDIDPDSIFGSKVPRCVLEDIFSDELYQQAGKNRPKRHRGSSGDWRKDRLGRHEVRNYKERMGQVRNWDFDKRAQNGTQTAAANAASAAVHFSMGRAG